MLSAADHNYGITALHNYGFTVILSPEKSEGQNFLPLKIETAHREGTLTHIQLPSWTRVPVEPSTSLKGHITL
jgi:hypothetical protein